MRVRFELDTPSVGSARSAGSADSAAGGAQATGHVVSFCDPRRFGTGQLALGGARARALPRRAPGRRAARPRLHLRAALPADAQPARADQGRPARPATRRGRRQHLRQRGAVSRAHPSAARSGPAQARRRRSAARRRRRLARGGRRRRRRDDRRLPPPRRRLRRLSERVPRPRPHGRAVRDLRLGDREVRRGRPRDVRVRDLPEAPAPPHAPRRAGDRSAKPRAVPAGGRTGRPRRSRGSRR